MGYVFPVTQLGCVEKPTAGQFEDGYVNASKPVKISGAFDSWPPVLKWTPEYIRRAIGDVDVNVLTSRTGRFEGDPMTGFAGPDVQRLMKVNSYLDWVYSEEPSDIKLYMAQVSIMQHFPKLAVDLAIPGFMNLNPSSISAVNLWFGKAGGIAPLHFDDSTNVLVQVKGQKRFMLFSPQDSGHVYPNPPDSKLNHCARADIEKPDLDAFPNLPLAHAYETVLNPGDAVFVPVGWWHQVYTITTGMSVNVWWNRKKSAVGA